MTTSDLWIYAIMLGLGFYEGLQKYAGDQTIGQRLLVTKNAREAGKGTAMGLWWVVAPIVSAGIVGLFFLALFSPRANRQGIYAGIAAATGFTAWATVTLNQSYTFDLGLLPVPVHGYLIGIISGALFVAVGYVVSLVFNERPPARQALTYWGWRAKRKAGGP